MRSNLLISFLFVTLSLAACRDKTPAPEAEATPEPTPVASAAAVTSSSPQLVKTPPPAARPAAPVAPDDPLQGQFELAAATKDLAGSGRLIAEIDTSQGKLICDLFADRAPTTVANFVGLARGLRPYKDPATKQWVTRKGYDGTTFHRVIKGFMIQGGDPEGTGKGEPGYVIPDEVWSGASHDQRGLICMANRGPNTNGMQFFVLDAPAKHLDRSYTIFGVCGPEEVIEKLASTPVEGEHPKSAPKIRKVTIRHASK